MAKTASEKQVKVARQAYKALVIVQSHSRAHRKVMHCLPKHKIKRYQKLGTQLTVKLYNAQNAWTRAIEQLTPPQVDKLFLEMVV